MKDIFLQNSAHSIQYPRNILSRLLKVLAVSLNEIARTRYWNMTENFFNSSRTSWNSFSKASRNSKRMPHNFFLILSGGGSNRTTLNPGSRTSRKASGLVSPSGNQQSSVSLAVDGRSIVMVEEHVRKGGPRPEFLNPLTRVRQWLTYHSAATVSSWFRWKVRPFSGIMHTTPSLPKKKDSHDDFPIGTQSANFCWQTLPLKNPNSTLIFSSLIKVIQSCFILSNDLRDTFESPTSNSKNSLWSVPRCQRPFFETQRAAIFFP